MKLIRFNKNIVPIQRHTTHIYKDVFNLLKREDTAVVPSEIKIQSSSAADESTDLQFTLKREDTAVVPSEIKIQSSSAADESTDLQSIYTFEVLKDINALNTSITSTTVPTTSIQEIPKIFHFIWLGDKIPPNEYNEYIRSWGVNYPEFKFMLWHDKNIPSDLVTGSLLEKEKRVVCRADILRYEILYKYGGIYVDMDFLSVNKMPNSMLYGCFFACESLQFISIGIIGSYPNNGLFYEILKRVQVSVGSDNITSNITKISGPFFLTKMYFDNKALFKDVTLYSSHHFYKYTFQDHHMGRKCNFDEYKLDKSIFGIHMWGNSWGSETKPYKCRHGDLPVSFLLSNTPDSIHPYMLNDDSVSKPYEMCIHHPKRAIVIYSPVIFSGGIERFISTLVNDGRFMPSHVFYVLAPSIVKVRYGFTNVRSKLLIYDTNEMAGRMIRDINPDIIIDNAWLYQEPTNLSSKYGHINMDRVIFIMHTSTHYSRDVSTYNIKNIIHLYDEKEQHKSYRDIQSSRIIPNGIYELNDDPDKLRISVIGRIAPDKINKEAIDVLSRKNISLNFYGDITDYDLIERVFKENCNVFPFMEIDAILQKTDVVFFMCEETCSYACLEGISRKKYIIAKRCCGMESILKEYSRGFLFDSCDELNDIIEKIHSLSGFLPTHVKQMYSFNRQRAEIESYITEIINRP